MANPHRGQVSLKAGDTTYTLSFSINAMCELEDLMNEPIAKIASGLNKASELRISTVRALAWAALRDHHADIDIKRAGEIVTEIGVPDAMAAIGKAFAAAFPEGGGRGNPRRAAKAS